MDKWWEEKKNRTHGSHSKTKRKKDRNSIQVKVIVFGTKQENACKCYEPNLGFLT